jgi:hypothetical protein
MNTNWPVRRSRVSLDCGKSGACFDGIVIERGLEQCTVRWSHGGEQSYPISHLVPFEETRRIVAREIKRPPEKELDLEAGENPFINPKEPEDNPFKGLFEPSWKGK